MTSLSDKPTGSPSEDAQDWNEAALAELVGLENQSRAEKAGSLNEVDEGNIISQGDLFDAPKENPHENKTERPLAKKPLPKLGLVAAGLLVVFGIGGLALSSMMSSKKTKFANPLTKPSSDKTSIVEKKSNESNQEGELKTQLAISKQEDDLKEIEARSKDRKKEKDVKPGDPNPEKDNKKTTAVPTTTAASSPPASYRSPPPRTYTSQPVRPAPVPVRPSPQAATSSPPSLPSPDKAQNPLNQQPIKPSDPVEQWHTLAMIGSYGRTDIEEDGDTRFAQVVEESPRQPSFHPKQPASREQAAQTERTQGRQRLPSNSEVLDDAERRILEGVPLRRLIPGVSASAALATSFLWSEDFPDEQHFVVALTEPLVGVDGREAIPVGQQIVFTVSGVDSNGLVSAVATGIIDEEGNEQPLPLGAITLQADKERPLLAEGLFDSGGEIAGMDLEIAALGAVSAVGEILNRPKQQQSTSSTGTETTTSTSSVSGNPNILGAVMNGATSPLLDAIQKRNEDAIKRLSDKKNAWFLPVGQSVQVFVTQAIEL